MLISIHNSTIFEPFSNITTLFIIKWFNEFMYGWTCNVVATLLQRWLNKQSYYTNFTTIFKEIQNCMYILKLTCNYFNIKCTYFFAYVLYHVTEHTECYETTIFILFQHKLQFYIGTTISVDNVVATLIQRWINVFCLLSFSLVLDFYACVV